MTPGPVQFADWVLGSGPRGSEKRNVPVGARRERIVSFRSTSAHSGEWHRPRDAPPAKPCSGSQPHHAVHHVHTRLSSTRAQVMLRFSSKRARSSIMAVTCLPFSAARVSAVTMGESALVRYKVCLMASTSGSLPPWTRNPPRDRKIRREGARARRARRSPETCPRRQRLPPAGRKRLVPELPQFITHSQRDRSARCSGPSAG